MGTKLWGVGGVRGEDKPNWLKPAQLENTFATKDGWVLRHPSGIEETLVSVANLKSKLGAATITSIQWGTGAFTAGSVRTVRVTYNEKVTVTGTPTLVVSGTVTASTTASFTSVTGQGNVVVFSFTVPAAGQTLSIGAQSISLAGGTITETGVTPTVNAELAISAAIGTAAKTKVTVA